MPEHTLMNQNSGGWQKRQIQERSTNDELCMSQEGESHHMSGPLPGSRAGRGAPHMKDNELLYE
eukprot:4890636-Amphidinium_carterae.1